MVRPLFNNMDTKNIQPIAWPVVKLGDFSLTFRVAYAAHFQLAQWGKNIASATILELAAASAGRFVDGKWRSEGFPRAVDLADLMEDGDESRINAAVLDALKKAYPEAEIALQPNPAKTATMSDGSGFGPSEPVPTALG